MRQMVTESYGDDTWLQVLAASGLPENAFLATQSYDDTFTYALAGAVSEVLDTPLDECLELFGQYWMNTFAPEDYELLLRASGDNIFEFLENLDALHDRITTTFVNYRPPSFSLERHSENSATVHYVSSRQGLAPFVIGLLKGMQNRFNVELEFESIIITPSPDGDQAQIKLQVHS
jgi:guanylate cyclase soluble subunit beta